LLSGCATTVEKPPTSQPAAAAEPESPEVTRPDLEVATSDKGILLAFSEKQRALTVPLRGDHIVHDEESEGFVFRDGERRIWISYDEVADFGAKPTTAPRTKLEMHREWRFETEWGEMLRTVELSRRIRSGEDPSTLTSTRSYAATNPTWRKLNDGSWVALWEVDLQEATGVLVNPEATARLLYWVFPFESGVLVVNTEVLTKETERTQSIRADFTERMDGVSAHQGTFDFSSYATARGWKIKDGSTEAEPSVPPPEVALEYCQKGEPMACRDLGLRYFFGKKGAPQDYEKAKEYFLLACEQDDPPGCIGLAGQYANGGGVERDMNKAGIYLDKACRLGAQDGGELAEQLAREQQ